MSAFDPGQIEAFILAGGASRRMGRDKARLPVGDLVLVQHVAALVAPHARRVRLIAKRDNDLEDLGIPLLYDDVQERAAVAGIRTALAADGAPWRWILACDMPAAGAELLRALWDRTQEARAPGACARLPGSSQPEPLPSLWHARLAARIAPAWGLSARAWVRRAGLAVWDVPRASVGWLVNVNTPEEWEAYRMRAQGGP